MKRIRLDNIETDDIHAIADINALARTNYAGSLRIAKLYALIAVATRIQMSLSQTVPNIRHDSAAMRTNRIAYNIAEIHVNGIKKRILQVEQINARKASKLRREKSMVELAELLTETNSLSRIAKLAPSPGLPVIPPEIRAKIAAPIIAELNAPSTDESYADTIARIEALEASRQTVPGGAVVTEAITKSMASDAIVTELTDGFKSIDTGDKLGSAEDWLK